MAMPVAVMVTAFGSCTAGSSSPGTETPLALPPARICWTSAATAALSTACAPLVQAAEAIPEEANRIGAASSNGPVATRPSTAMVFFIVAAAHLGGQADQAAGRGAGVSGRAASPPPCRFGRRRGADFSWKAVGTAPT